VILVEKRLIGAVQIVASLQPAGFTRVHHPENFHLNLAFSGLRATGAMSVHHTSTLIVPAPALAKSRDTVAG
jgi:hypothetical protein